MKKILLLEDDMNLSETISAYLEEQDFEIISVYDGYSAQDAIYENTFDLLLLDVNVPDINGFEVLQDARERGIKTPAIYITSLNSMEDFEQGYESGCDDYIRKPFALKELLIRIETILKREFFHQKDSRIQIDENIFYDTQAHQLIIDEKPVTLNNKDAKLLQLFLKHQNELLTHEMIYAALWDYDEEISESALRTYIKNLRKLLGKERIVSLKKLGYRFTSK